MGNIGIDVSKQELANQCRDGIRLIHEQRKLIDHLTEEIERLKKENAKLVSSKELGEC